MSGIDPRRFRDTLGNFATGVVVVTGCNDGVPAGFAAQSFTSLSLSPPLVAVCPARTSSSWPRVRAAGAFCINVLGADQKHLCDRFARSGEGKFTDVAWQAAATGSPVLAGVVAWIDCRLDAEHEAGDHTIAVGRVVDIGVAVGNGEPPRAPLLFYRGGYGTFVNLAAD